MTPELAFASRLICNTRPTWRDLVAASRIVMALAAQMRREQEQA